MLITEEKIKEVADKIAKKYKPEKIILFGSWAWGQPDEDSDVDLFIVKKSENTRKIAREIDGSIRPRPFPLDLIVYKPESVERGLKINDFFIKKIIREGKILYTK